MKLEFLNKHINITFFETDLQNSHDLLEKKFQKKKVIIGTGTIGSN